MALWSPVEGELRQQVVDLKSEIVSLKSTIEQKVEVIRDVTSQLEKTAEELQDLRDEQAHRAPQGSTGLHRATGIPRKP